MQSQQIYRIQIQIQNTCDLGLTTNKIQNTLSFNFDCKLFKTKRVLDFLEIALFHDRLKVNVLDISIYKIQDTRYKTLFKLGMVI